MWDLLLKNEMMRSSGHGEYIDTEAPWNGDEPEQTNFTMQYITIVERQYKKYKVRIAEVNSTEQEEFQAVLSFGKSRTLGLHPQPLDVNLPIPPPPPKTQQSAWPPSMR